MKRLIVFLGTVGLFYNVSVKAREYSGSDKPVIGRIVCNKLAENEENASYGYKSFHLRAYKPSDPYLAQYGTWYHYIAEYLDFKEIHYLYESGFLLPKYSSGEEYIISIPGAPNDSQKIQIKKAGETWNVLFLGRNHFVDCSIYF